MPQNQRPWENVAYRRRDFYIYEAEVVALGVGLSSNDTIAIEADSDFILQKLTFQADLAGVAQDDATRVVPNVLIQLTDTGSGRQLMQNPIPVTSFFGTGRVPFILPNPRLFMRNSTIQIAFTSFEVADTPTVRLAFIGYKMYGTA
jgi:hypothetical protein